MNRRYAEEVLARYDQHPQTRYLSPSQRAAYEAAKPGGVMTKSLAAAGGGALTWNGDRRLLPPSLQRLLAQAEAPAIERQFARLSKSRAAAEAAQCEQAFAKSLTSLDDYRDEQPLSESQFNKLIDEVAKFAEWASPPKPTAKPSAEAQAALWLAQR